MTQGNDLGDQFSKKEPHTPSAQPASAEKPSAPSRIRWEGDMIPRKVGYGKRIERSGGGGFSYSPSVRLEWVSRQTDAEGKPLRVRVPEGISVTAQKECFMAAGKQYTSLSQLTAQQESKDSPWFKDVYGRDVLELKERFPCFDSYDLLNEERYFRWYFLCQDGRLICVYHTDDSPDVTVTEDVLDVEDLRWEKMEKLGCFK